jgi:hypothetical protein
MRPREFITITGGAAGADLPRRGRNRKTRSVKRCDVRARNRAILTRTHFFDASEAILQRSNGDHQIAAPRIQIIRIRAWTVLGGVKSISSASKVRDQLPDLHHGLCRHNAALSSDLNLTLHFNPSKE